jgi:hypothetical protein
MKNIATSKFVSTALLCVFMMGFSSGCSRTTATKVASDIVNWTPALTSAVAVVDSTAASLLPADAIIFTAVTAGFDAASTLVVAEAQAYLANPSATTLVILQNGITTLQQNTSAALLNAIKISDPNSQRLALAAINGIALIANTILALVQSISSPAQLKAMSARTGIKFSTIRPLLDKKKMDNQAAKFGITTDQFFTVEAQKGF